MLTTPPLGKPFKSIKYVAYHLCDAQGVWQAGRIHIYLDPRGDAGFACGIHSFVKALIDGSSDEYGERLPHIHTTKDGIDFVKCATAADLERDIGRVYRKFSEIHKTVNRTEVISIDFHGIAPKYDEFGVPVDQEWEYKHPFTSYRGGAGKRMELHLTFLRGFKVGTAFFVEREGKLTQVPHGSFMQNDGVLIPYTDETWAQLVSVRDTVSKAIVMLGGVFGDHTADIPKLLAMASQAPALLAPEPTSASRIRRSRVRRTEARDD